MENKFINQSGFRKGHLVSHSKNAYQDPTYLSFVLVFDTINSPLLNKEQAVKFLRDFYGETDKAVKLEQFIDTLILLNKEMPWYWKSIDGVDRAIKIYENFKDSYAGGDDAILDITCMESINLAVSGLMDLYRQAVYDSAKWTQVLPVNMRHFRMQVIVSEVRDQRHVSDVSIDAEQIINSDLVSVMPKFVFEFDYCQFKPESASEAFSGLSMTDMKMADDLHIQIAYEDVTIMDTQYLNGVIDDQDAASDLSLNTIGNPLQAFGDRIAGNDGRSIGGLIKKEVQNIKESLKSAYEDDLRRLNPKRIINRPDNVYGSALERYIIQQAAKLDQFAGRSTRIPDNVYRSLLNSGEDAGESFRRSLPTNIYGTVPGQAVESALRRGAIQSIFPMINTQRSNLNPGTNIFE